MTSIKALILFAADTLLGKVVRHRQTPEESVKVQAMVEFSSTSEGINFTKISCTLPGSGGKIYDGHLPLLGENFNDFSLMP